MNPHLTLTLSPPIGSTFAKATGDRWERRGDSQGRWLFSARNTFMAPMRVQS